MRGVLCYTDKGAGLGDRVHVLLNLLRWAWALDVRLNIPPPCKWLSPNHNFGAPLECNSTWDRYLSVAPRSLLTAEPCALILRNFYAVDARLLDAAPVTVQKSQFVREEALKLSRDMGLPPKYDFMHIRRTDAIRECNTNLVRMKRILRDRRFVTAHVVYTTDEPDAAYSDAITEALATRNLTVYRPQEWLLPRFPRDNYMVFSIEEHLMSTASATHEWHRRESCPPS